MKLNSRNGIGKKIGKKNEWKYVAKKVDERHHAGKKSMVLRDGVIIPYAKVKKEISRHGHPNDQFSRGELSFTFADLIPLIVE